MSIVLRPECPRSYTSIVATLSISKRPPRCADDPKGQGADLSLAECEGSFDGTAACVVNDTVFMKGYAGHTGGAVSLSGGDHSWDVEFHRCWVENSSAGFVYEDEPQGEGGAFAVGEGVTLLLTDCLLKGISCRNKVRLVFVAHSISLKQGRHVVFVGIGSGFSIPCTLCVAHFGVILGGRRISTLSPLSILYRLTKGGSSVRQGLRGY